MAKRVCIWCKRTLVTAPHGDDQAQAHCDAAGCYWCADCQTERTGQSPEPPKTPA